MPFEETFLFQSVMPFLPLFVQAQGFQKPLCHLLLTEANNIPTPPPFSPPWKKMGVLHIIEEIHEILFGLLFFKNEN